MILVTGATGTIGREVVRRIPADLAVRIMARHPERVTGAGAGAEIVHGDFSDPASLAGVLRGVRTVFLVTNPGRDDDEGFIRAARSAGVRQVVKLSAAAVADSRAEDLITRWQRRNEDLLRGSGMEWTLLRPRAFMSNALSWAGSIRSDDVVRALYGASANACVDPRDVAEVAVRALTEDGHAGRVHTLTGPEAISAAEQTAQLAELLRRPLRFEELGPEQARTALGARYPADIVEALLESAERGREGAKAEVDGTVAGLLGRPAGTFRGWAADHLSAFGNASR
ncbi:SDR family oxidoreductase [Streptomyces sp. NBC_00378]|uniref:SDR family oxidoreductase n=1 Tax=unclassified Streptomyces TaxID=2593676 RepID=UPI00224F6DEF|nr:MULTISPECIES: SDR family oxidoreductase [unclassified Streptomyces]MCX5115100.1 SDR family oxidoreductase [Streptomyces sp. NBC_00378]